MLQLSVGENVYECAAATGAICDPQGHLDTRGTLHHLLSAVHDFTVMCDLHFSCDVVSVGSKAEPAFFLASVIFLCMHETIDSSERTIHYKHDDNAQLT